MRPCARGRQRLGLWLGSGLREALSGYLLIEPVTFLLRTSTSPAQRLGTTRRLHSGLATCERGVRMARPFAGGGRDGARRRLVGDLMEPSVQVRKRATKSATAWL